MSSSIEHPGRREALLVCVLIVAAVCAIYAPVRHHEFVDLGDVDGILEHPLLLEGLGPGTLARHFSEPRQGWIPLTWLSLHLNHGLGGSDPTGYLLTNVALHALGSLLLFGVLWRMTGAFYCAAFCALLFAVHPLHVESVAWASQRRDVLSGVFFMGTLWAHARFADRGGLKSGALVALALVLGLLSSPILVTLPFVLLLLDFWPLERLRAPADPRLVDPSLLRARVVEKLPLFAIVLAVSGLTLWLQPTGVSALGLERLTFGDRVANALNTYLVYLSQTALPQGLAALYPLPDQPDWAGAGGAAVLLLGASTIALAAARDRPYLSVGWLWFLGTLVPLIGLAQGGTRAHANHAMYLPQIGLSLALAWGAADLARRAPATRPAVAVVGTLVLGWFGGLAWQQVQFWKDTPTLLGHALAVTSGNYLAHKELADALRAEGRLADAAVHYREASALNPGWMDAELGLADALLELGQAEDAIPFYARWIQRAPESQRPLGSLGLALARADRFEEALPLLEAALPADPRHAELHAARGAALEALGRLREARDAYRQALRLEPDLTVVANNLAWLLATAPDAALRDPEQALALAQQALAAWPGDPRVLDPVAASYAAAGRFDEAIDTVDRGIAVARQLGMVAVARALSRRRALYARGEPHVEPL